MYIPINLRAVRTGRITKRTDIERTGCIAAVASRRARNIDGRRTIFGLNGLRYAAVLRHIDLLAVNRHVRLR